MLFRSVSRALGLRSIDDFEVASSATDPERPWVGDVLHDSLGTPWTRLKVAELLNHPRFLDAAQS